MDNFGPSMRLIKKFFSMVKISYSPANYEPRGKLYNYYLKTSFSALDRIYPLTEAYRKRLINLGLDEKKMQIIRWSAKLPAKILIQEEKDKVVLYQYKDTFE